MWSSSWIFQGSEKTTRVCNRSLLHLFHVIDALSSSSQDHNVIFCPYLASEDSETLDAIVRHEEPEFSSTSFRTQLTFVERT